MKTISDIKGSVHRLWWIPMVTGILSIALGIWCFCSPATSLPIFAIFFACVLIVAGVMNFCYAFSNRRINTNWGWSLALGLLELVCGIWLYTLPTTQLTLIFVYAVGFWLIFAAINAICEAATMSRFSGWWAVWMIILLVATIFFSFYFLTDPILGFEAGWLWLGISFIAFGCSRMSLGFWLTSINSRSKRDA